MLRRQNPACRTRPLSGLVLAVVLLPSGGLALLPPAALADERDAELERPLEDAGAPAHDAAEPASDESDESDESDDSTEAKPAAAGDTAESAKKKRPKERIETTNLEDPAFPTPRIRDAFRIRLQSRFLPAGAFDDFDVDLVRPELRLRVTAPLSKRAVLQFTGRFGTSLYDFDEGGDLLGTGSFDSLSDFYQASLGLQGGFRLNESRSLFVEGEMWSVLAAVRARSRWEKGAFADAITVNGAIALGYEIDNVIRIGIGVQLGSRLDRGGVRISPVANLKWDVTDRFTVRNRGQGLQLEYRLNKRFELFATGFLESDRFLLDDRPGKPGDLTFRDRTVLTGLGFEWRISKHFRVNVEGGAVAWREIRVRSRDVGTFFKEQGEPGAYFDVRFEVRP
ncbi:MAG: DUF6268 family outer membrane beta-barrel protein [Myxococcota bacterium]|nr:DUF6268 family outer membrane beta-barrel protein [Myxococcota bacterium]